MALPTIITECRLAADPELRFAPSGVAIASMRAVAGARKQVNNEWVDGDQSWFNITLFKEHAENAVESLTKGMVVAVVGRLHVREYEDREGNKRISVDVLADTVAPVLKYATAKVTKTGGQGGSGNQSSGQRNQSSGGGGQQQSAASGPDPWAPPQQDDEPPF